MSMLTPPGMGGKYRIKGDRYPRMRRSRGRGKVITAYTAAVLAIAVIGWGTLQLIDVFSGGSGGNTAGTASGSRPSHCATTSAARDDRPEKTPGDEKGSAEGKDSTGDKGSKEDKGDKSGGKGSSAAPGKLPEPGSITVNVLNATSRSGLAKDTSEELKKRGFKIGKVGNAPAELDKKVKKAGVLLGAPGGDTAARLKVLGTQLRGADTRYEKRDGEEIDLVIGKGFTKLTKESSANAALHQLTAEEKRKTRSEAPC